MKLKQLTTRIAIFSALLGLHAQAAPFMAVGDNAELFVTAAVALRSDDNIYLDPTAEVSDTIYSFTPGLDLVFGKGSITKGNLYYREEIRRYSNNDNQDTELSNVGFRSDYDNGVTKADFNASYAQVAQNDNNVRATGVIVQRQLTNLGAKGEFTISEKTSLAVGIMLSNTNYNPVAYTDSSIVSLPIDVYYRTDPKLSWSLGYAYRSTNLGGGGNDSNDNFLNIGARGEFTPKLTGQIRLGYTQRSFDVGGDQSLFGFNGSLAYQLSDKTSYQVNGSNDFGSSGYGDSTKNFSLGFSANSKISEQWAFNGGLSYRRSQYARRTDDFVEGLLAVTYALNNTVNFGASYTYRNNSSSAAGLDFTNSVFSLGANVRY
ncbi:MAG: outer membrane beta-barrel protein [Opitutae bacterium]|nr:outer membrane beta-barrel protein [Opitutae bacterium]